MEEENHLDAFEAIKPNIKETLQSEIRAYRDHPEQGPETAYRLAGMLSRDEIRKAPADDPYVAILALAGQLELPEAHRASGSSWDQLIAMVEAL